MTFNIKKFINKNGGINSNLTKNISEYDRKYIIEHTSFLINPTITQRLKALILNVKKHELCQCGTPLPFSPTKDNLFKNFCSNKCVGKYRKTDYNKFKNTIKNKKTREELFNELIPQDHNNKDDIIKFINEKKTKSQFVFYDDYIKNKKILETAIYLTPNIDAQNWSERFYNIIYPGIYKCEYCNENVGYNGFFNGYAKTCNKCKYLDSAKSKIEYHKNILFNEIKKYNYEIIKYTSLNEKSKVKCKKY